MNQPRRIVIVGATSAIAEHCARLWITRDDCEMTLVGRDKTRTDGLAADLRARNPAARVTVHCCDFHAPQAIAGIAALALERGPVDIVLIAHGSLPDQFVCQDDLSACWEALQINAISPVLFAEAFAGPMEKSGKGSIAIIGSVAGDRGRKSNYVYGAAKGLIERYAEGLQHRFAASGPHVVLIKPGPTDTPMTAHLKEKGVGLADVKDVAKAIVAAIDAGKSVAYAPAKWWLIMAVIRLMPRAIFNKLDI